MTNTKIIPHTFEYFAPETLAEVLEHLHNPEAKVLAGGTDLVNRLKLRTADPKVIVYLGRVKELHEIGNGNNGEEELSIGAMVSMRELEQSKLVRDIYPCLYEALHCVGGVQIRNSATVAGNIANASPAADSPPALMVLDAECELVSLDNGHGSKNLFTRLCRVEDMFEGPGKTTLKPGECISRIVLPKPVGNYGTAFLRSTRVKLDVAKASCAAYVERDGSMCTEIRIAAGAVAPMPVRIPSVERLLRGKKVTAELFDKAAAEIGKDIRPIDDVRSTETYRSRIMKVLVRDALCLAWKRAGGEDFSEEGSARGGNV